MWAHTHTDADWYSYICEDIPASNAVQDLHLNLSLTLNPNNQKAFFALQGFLYVITFVYHQTFIYVLGCGSLCVYICMCVCKQRYW